MMSLWLAAWMALPIYPLNPVEQDTLNQMNLHLTVGLTSPNKIADPGLQFSAKYELLVVHPLVVRFSADYGFQELRTQQLPDGALHSLIISVDALYYRGTDELTGFVGLGAMLYQGFFRLDRGVDNLTIDDLSIDDLSFRPHVGLRGTLGLRFSRNFSLELAVSEVRPTLVTTGRVSEVRYREITEQVKLHDVRLTLGYLFSLRT